MDISRGACDFSNRIPGHLGRIPVHFYRIQVPRVVLGIVAVEQDATVDTKF